MKSCFLFFDVLKCFSPAADHTVVETLCLRKDSGTDVTAGYVALCAHWLTKLSAVLLLSCVYMLSGSFCSRLMFSFVFCLALVSSQCFCDAHVTLSCHSLAALVPGQIPNRLLFCQFLLLTADDRSMLALL